MRSRRPDSVLGLLGLLLRTWRAANPRAFQRAALLGGGVALSGAAALVAGLSARPCVAPRVEARASAPASRLVSLVPARCEVSARMCFRDSDCGGHDRCVDGSGVTAIVHGLMAQARANGDDDASFLATVAWSGSRYGVAWVGLKDERFSINFAQVSAEGARVGGVVRVAQGAGTNALILPSLAASPNGWALGWTEVSEDGVGAHFQRLNANGQAEGRAEALESGFNAAPRLVWNGREYAAAWYNVGVTSQMSLHFARIGADGKRVGRTSTAARGFLTAGAFGFAFTGDAYGLGWTNTDPRDERSETLFVRVGAGGEAGNVLRVGPNATPNLSLALAWNGRHFGAVWEDNLNAEDDTPTSRLIFAGLTPSGVAAPRRALSDGRRLVIGPSLAAQGERFSLASTVVSNDGIDVELQGLSAQGAPEGQPVRVTQGEVGALPSLVFTGREYGLAYTQLDAQGISIQFARYDTSLRRIGRGAVISAAP